MLFATAAVLVLVILNVAALISSINTSRENRRRLDRVERKVEAIIEQDIDHLLLG